jgi:hypothetical protein
LKGKERRKNKNKKERKLGEGVRTLGIEEKKKKSKNGMSVLEKR